MTLPSVFPGHAAHRADALVVEDLQPFDQLLGQGPALAAAQNNGQDHSHVDSTFSNKGDSAGAEKAFAECSESLPS